jgi:Chaperone of endosialidase
MGFLGRLSLLRSLAIVLVPAVVVVAAYHFSIDKPLSSAQVLQQVARDPEFIKYFGQGLASLDTDKDGVADAKDPDIDNDGTPNAQDPDIDNDGTSNAQDPSTALTALAGESEDEGLENKTAVAGKDGQDGADGANGKDGAAGVQGLRGTVGVVTDDGVVQTSLTGSDLDIQVLVAVNSGLAKMSTGLSLKTDCNTGEVLQWSGSSWDCSTTSGGISYTSGSGISISSNVISSVLGSSIDTSELNDGSVTTIKLADGSITASKIVDGTIVTAKLSDGGVTTAKIADNAVSTAKIVDSSVTYAKLQNVAANSLIGNPTGSAASASEISLGQGLSISGSTLNNAGILTIAVSGPLTVSGGQNKTLGIVRATGLVDGYVSASDFAQFSSKQAALTAGSGISLAGNTVSFDPATFSSVSSIAGADKLVVVTGAGTKNISYNDLFGGVLGSLNYRGSWDAAANTPNLTAACTTGTKGYYYVVSTAGTTSIDGSSSWNVGDWVVCNGSIFQQVQTTNGVSSVFGRTGTIAAQSGDYTASQISNTPTGNISSSTVQGAINQLDSSKLTASLADGLLYIGNSSGIASPVSLSGDATVTNTGTLTIGSGAVTTAKIADGTITFADLASNSCSNGQVIKYNGSNWSCSNDNTVSTGDLTTSTNGLTVTGGTGSVVGSGVTLNIATAGTSQNGLLAATDWNTFNAKENALTFTGRGIFTRTGNAVNAVVCTNGEVLKYSGTLWQCGQDIDTTYLAGTGLSLSGATFNLGNTSVTSGIYGAASSVPVLTVDAQGRLTGVTNTTISGLTTSNLSAGAGITNAQLANPGITFALGTSGSDVAWGATTVNLGGTATLNIPDASASARGLINVTAQTIAGDKTLSGNTTLEGSFATKKGTDFSTTGTSNDANFGNTSLVRLTGASAQTITGIAGGTDGKLLTIINAGANAATISNESTSSTAANRTKTGTGADLTLAPDASLSLVYDSGASRWRVVGGTGGGTSYASVDITDKATGGAIGAAAATVDIATNFNVDQTTASQTLTIPSPTNTTTTKGKIVTLNNVGTANFTMGTVTVPAGSYGSAFVWTGTAWNPINAASNVAGATFSASKSSTSTSSLTTVAGNTTTLQPTTARLPLSGAGIDTNASGVTVGANSITILQTGKYRLSGNWNTGNSSGQSFLGHQYIKNNATILPGGVFGLNDTTVQGGTSYSSSVDVDLVAGDIIDMRIYGNTSTSTNYLGYSFSASLISGNAPVTGQSVDYIHVSSATLNQPTTANAAVVFPTILNGNIPYNTANGQFSLTAGKTYRLEGSPTGGVVYWYNVTGNASLSEDSAGNATSASANLEAVSYFTPTVNSIVELRAAVTGSQTSANGIGSGSFTARIQQIGSTNLSTGIALNTLTSAVANGSLDNTNYTQTWNYSTATTQTGLLALNANALTSGILQQLATSSTAFTGSLLNLSSTGNNAAVTGSLAKFDIVGSASAAKGLQINNAGTGNSLDINNTGTGLAANFGGAIATKAGTTYTTPGSANDVAFANASYIRLDTSGATQTITGIANGVDGKLLTLSNADASLAVTLSNQSTSSVAANRIVTGTGSDLAIAAGASVNLIYDATDARWRVVGGTGSGSTASSTTISTNFPTGGSIGTASATVDTNSSIILSGQTTTGQSLSLPNPTNTAAGKIVTITSTSTASFAMYTTQLSASSPSASFIWTGSAWNPIGASANVASEYGENTTITTGQTTTSTSFVDVTGGSFTLPSAGTWDVAYSVFTNNNNVGSGTAVQVATSAGVVVPNSFSAMAEASGGGTTGSNYSKVTITTTGAATYKLQWRVDGGTATLFNNATSPSAGGSSKVTYQKISGNAPVTGQSVDYLNVARAAAQTVTNNSPVLFDTTISGNIPYNSGTGIFTLTAGKTYKLESAVRQDNVSASSASWQWQTSAGVALNANGGGSVTQTTDSGNSSAAQQLATIVYTPTVNTSVQLRNISGATRTLTTGAIGENYAVITQLGSTASTGVAMSSLTAAIANNSLDNTNYAQTWNWSLATTETGLAMNFNALTSGNGLALASSSTGLTGNLFSATSASTAAATNGLVRFNFTGAYTGNGVQIDTATATGIGLSLNANSLTTGSGLSVTSSYAAGNSTNGLLYVANTGAVTNGVIARVQSNSTAGSGLTVLANGKVGIGTTSPTGATLQLNDTTGEGLLITSTNAIEGGQVTFGGASGQAAYQIDNFNDGSAQDFRVLEGNTVRAYLTVGSNGWITPSDARLKDNIMALDNVLEKLEGVRGTSYRLKDSGALQIGVIAQEFKDAFPGAVSGDETTGLLGVSYDSVAAIAIQGIKELNMKVESNKIAIDGQVLDGISEVDSRLTQINDGLTAVSGSVTEINTALDTFNQRIASLDGRLSALEQATPQTNTTQVINNTITQTIQDSRQAGTAKISAGKIGVRVIFAKTYTAAPIVYLTPVGNKTTYHIENVTTSGFTVMLDEAATAELTFNWLGLEQAEDASTEQIDGPLVSTP